MTYKGEVLDGVLGDWEPIVDVDTWRAVQDILRNPARRTSPGPKVRTLLGGIVACGTCQKPMRSAAGRNGSPAYRCAIGRKPGGDSHAWIGADLAEAGVLDAVWNALLRRHLDGIGSTAEPGDPSPLRAERADLNEERTRWTAVAALPGADLKSVSAELARIEARVQEIDAALVADAQGRARRGIAAVISDVFAAGHDIDAMNTPDALAEHERRFDSYWADLDLEERRELIRETITITAYPRTVAAREGVARVTYQPKDATA